MGFFSRKTRVPATGFFAMPQNYQNMWNQNMAAGQSAYYNPDGSINADVFTPQGPGAEAMMRGFTPTADSLRSDISMFMNPFDENVINEINRDFSGKASAFGSNLSQTGQFGSNRGILGMNDIDMARRDQIGRFKADQYNRALNQALGLSDMRREDAMGQLDIDTRRRQAGINAVNSAQGFLQGTPSQFGNFGSPAYTQKSSGFGRIMDLARTAAQVYAASGSDIRIKDNIKYIGQENGHSIYEFNYRDVPDKKWIGVIAQEVMMTNPEAVVVGDDGYLAVRYDLIGVKFREVQ